MSPERQRCLRNVPSDISPGRTWVELGGSSRIPLGFVSQSTRMVHPDMLQAHRPLSIPGEFADRLDPERVRVGVDVGESSLLWAVELRREESRGALEHLIRPLQLEVLALQPLEALTIIGGQPCSGAGVDLGPAHPPAQRLSRRAHLGRHRPDRGPQRPMLLGAFQAPGGPTGSRISLGNLLVRVMAPSSHGLEPPGYPSRFTTRPSPTTSDGSTHRSASAATIEVRLAITTAVISIAIVSTARRP